ncbi:ATP-binding protein [bacterium]|nr:ATP-binding protein [bacterium]
MINIKNLCVDGFKNIHELTINLNKINTFLSSNNYGKSNVLTSINFGFDFISASSNDKKNMMSWKPGLPLNITDFGKNFRFEIVFECFSDETKIVKYGYEFAWAKNSKQPGVIVAEYLKVKQNDSQKFATFIDRTTESAKYQSAPKGRCDKDIIINDSELIINKISAFDDLFYLDVVSSINELNIFVDRHFDARELFDAVPIIQKNNDNLSLYSDNNIARTLYYLKKEHKNKYELIINTLMDFFPYINDVKIKEINLAEKNLKVNIDENSPFELADYIYTLYVNDKYMAKTIPFNYMSDGVKRILSLLTYMTLADIKGVPLIGIEEPENSVHPGLLKKYIDVIDGFMEYSKVIITSHSPYLINYIDLKNLYIGEPTSDGRAIFKSISNKGINKIIDYAEEMGVQTGEYLFSVVSGYDEFDLDLVKKYLEND